MGLLGESIIKGVRDLFLPSDGFFKAKYDELKEAFFKSIPLLNEINLFFKQFQAVNISTGKVPSFKMTMPDKFGGGEYNIINFSFFDDYRDVIHQWIKFGGWFYVIIKLIKRLPNYIS